MMRTVDEIKKDITKVNGRLEYIGELESKMAARKESLEKELKEAYAENNPFTMTDRYGKKSDELDTIWFVNDLGFIDCLDVDHTVICTETDEWYQKYQHLKTVNNNTAGVYASKETADFALKKIRLLNVMLYFKDKYDIEAPLRTDNYTIRYSTTEFKYYVLSSDDRDPTIVWFHSYRVAERCVDYLNTYRDIFS